MTAVVVAVVSSAAASGSGAALFSPPTTSKLLIGLSNRGDLLTIQALSPPCIAHRQQQESVSEHAAPSCFCAQFAACYPPLFYLPSAFCFLGENIGDALVGWCVCVRWGVCPPAGCASDLALFLGRLVGVFFEVHVYIRHTPINMSVYMYIRRNIENADLGVYPCTCWTFGGRP